tara:strand:- start:423 stop:1283 length:861 start_codon:yes stop_codon:yes gene_type:complete
MTTARSKYAFGFCDRTGFRYPLNELVDEFKNGVKTGLRVGRDVADGDHPQNFLGRVRIFDPQSLSNARPDRSLEESRQLFGFNPVWNPAQFMTGSVGRAVVSFDESVVNATGVSGTTSVGAASALTFTASPIAPSRALTAVGTVTITGDIVETVPVTGSSATSGVGSAVPLVNVTQIFTITVASAGYGSGNKFYIDGVQAPSGSINEGSTYLFDQSDSSNSGHPLRFSTTSDGTHNSGVEYTTGVTTVGTPGNAGAYTQIVVASGAPTLYYYCTNHSGMGGQANTP